ncbi:DNA-binding domain-containing protein [Pseudomonas borbori]|uniref:Putative DNA-binding domain-containing protein n=1 Tax=Pseudomonas borbori TaxID=289003 RepID=A0A1I5V739_9PSED|nr:DNA-binding domain-containing protein [Pseudomonas borbori]SFQ03260.1 Putative DNA-binding domain-containing protein [Pseudomonas borbori]
MRLSAQQKALERYLATGDSVIPPELLEQIQGSNTLPAADGLMIYQNAYRARLLSVMREDFPALHRWMGDESFAQLAMTYISAWPSRHFSLRWLGEKLPEFIRGYIAEPQRSPMIELATLEWAFTLAFDAPDAVPLSLDLMSRFSADDWVNLRVCLTPSARWLQLQHNTVGMWAAAKAEADMPDAVALSEPLDCLVWRRELVCQYRTLEPGEAAALRLLIDGGSFASMCENLVGQHGEQAPLQAATWLKQWVGEGLLQRG